MKVIIVEFPWQVEAIINKKEYLSKAHNLYKQGNYSGSIKFANSLYECTDNKKEQFNIN